MTSHTEQKSCQLLNSTTSTFETQTAAVGWLVTLNQCGQHQCFQKGTEEKKKGPNLLGFSALILTSVLSDCRLLLTLSSTFLHFKPAARL